jgi:hypothetical protein
MVFQSIPTHPWPDLAMELRLVGGGERHILRAAARDPPDQVRGRLSL